MTGIEDERLMREYMKQKEELEKLIVELQSQMTQTNIPLDRKYTEKYPIYNAAAILGQNQGDLLRLKLFVNKKCNQISNDMQHTQGIIQDIRAYEKDGVFRDIFLLKLLDQGKVTVASHLDFYRPLGFILSQLDASYESFYVRLLIYKSANEAEIKGIYAIYFGALYYKNDYKGAWFFLASILNVAPGAHTPHVLQVYFVILAELLGNHSKRRLAKILSYLNRIYFVKMNNHPIQIRITQAIEKYI
ncbi:hypothetical protein ECANGB1_1143 [Enterospora canceri]|uniref:Uncharacterized protein n=1 Tax=Enterospora canceri TaxID=1081671 RepID=A0A1Y1S7W9_9MICR|nr:hypothetical protein ECANGB1_1143 [Enterospora canceri]